MSTRDKSAEREICRLCASSVQITQMGESPIPIKLSEQSVLSLGAEAVRLGLSVGKGA